jgi:3-dehydroquinate dehydratase type I
MICLSVDGSSMRQLLKNIHSASRLSDCIEARIDKVRDFSLPTLLSRKIIPTILTCHSKSTSGFGPGNENKRIKLLSSAIASGKFKYVTVDIPNPFKVSVFISSLINQARLNNSKLILSYHDYKSTPDNLKVIYQKLSAFNPAVIKIVTYAQNVGDNFKVLGFAQEINSLNSPSVDFIVDRPALAGCGSLYSAAPWYATQPAGCIISRPCSNCRSIGSYTAGYSRQPRGMPRNQRGVPYNHLTNQLPNYKSGKPAGSPADRDKPKLIAFCMGESGIISRILYKKFGLFLTYASYADDKKTADGQLPFGHMKYIYRADSLDSNTRIFGLVGYPINYSLSPLLFNFLLKTKNVNAVYLPFAIKPDRFPRDFSLINSFLKPEGYSVTSPYKIPVIKLLDRIDKTAREIKAVNTVYRRSNKLIGTNTDLKGVLESLLPIRKSLQGREAFVLGYGGVAKAIIHALKQLRIKTTVFSRHTHSRLQLHRQPNYQKGIVKPWRALEKYCRDKKGNIILINATPVGAYPHIIVDHPALAGCGSLYSADPVVCRTTGGVCHKSLRSNCRSNKSPVKESIIEKDMIVFDVIYNPHMTKFLKIAKQKGCRIINGLNMFIVQAMEQFKYFTRTICQ